MNELVVFCLSFLSLLNVVLVSTISTHEKILNSSSDTLYFYVSPKGNDNWSGKVSIPEEHVGPFATPYRAVEAVKEQRADAEKALKPIVVEFAGGNYFLNRSIIIDSALSGTPLAPTTFRAADGHQVCFIGGIEINAKDLLPLSRRYHSYLPAEIQDSIYEFDAKRAEIEHLGELNARGFARPEYAAPAELFFNRSPLKLSRLPNTGWAEISDVPEGKYSGQFVWLDRHLNKWKFEKKIWLQGFWANDYADTYIQVTHMDTVDHTIFTHKTHNKYGFIKGKRFRVINVLEELDEPGEYYIDFDAKKILFWPPTKIKEGELTLSLLEKALLRIKNAKNIFIQGITFEITRGKAILIEEGESNTVYNCIIRNTGQKAIEVLGGNKHKIAKSEIYDTGEGAILLKGGDRKTLVPSDHIIANSHIYCTNRLVNTSNPSIRIEGVGNVIRNNYIHNLPFMAIRIYGNENIIEYNEIADIGKEAGDTGAIYIGRDWSMQGNIIRYNFFHDMRSSYYRGVIGVYLDDLASGTNVHNNIFKDVQSAVVIGGGRSNNVTANIFENSSVAAVKIEYRQRSARNSEEALRARLASVPYQSRLWRKKYPQLTHVLEDDPLAPKYNIILNNVVTHGKWLIMDNHVKENQKIKKNIIQQNTTIFHKNLLAPERGSDIDKVVSDIPFEKIGLQK